MTAISIRLPNSLHEAAKVLAKREQISINQFIVLAVSEKLSALGTVDILEQRAKRASRKKFLNVLKSAPDIEPENQDML